MNEIELYVFIDTSLTEMEAVKVILEALRSADAECTIGISPKIVEDTIKELNER